MRYVLIALGILFVGLLLLGGCSVQAPESDWLCTFTGERYGCEEAGTPEDDEAEDDTEAEAPEEPTDTDVELAPPGRDEDIEANRGERLLELDPTFRNTGLQAWAREAGFEFESMRGDARQPEEETFLQVGGQGGEDEAVVVVSGFQVVVEGLVANWPACFTTDKEVSGGRSHRPDNYDPIRNPSALYTDNDPYDGTATIWADCSNWPQLGEAADDGDIVYQSEEELGTGSDVCMSLAELAEMGDIVQELEYPSGTLAGAQIDFSQDWTAPAGWTVQHNGSDVGSVVAGDTASVWSPEACRPLSDS
jgi:hypothetical protein